MLQNLFLQILDMSFTASMVIMVVLAARMLLKRAPKMYSYALWSVVLIRLLFPFSLESVVSLLPLKTTSVTGSIAGMALPDVSPEAVAVIPAAAAGLETSLPPSAPYASADPLQLWIFAGGLIWVIGFAALLLYSLISLLKLRNRLKDAVHCSENIYTSNRIHTAFVMGVFRPVIYLPAHLSDKERSYILLHEQTHIRRFDPIIKLVAFLALCAHWFNPLVWLAFFLSAKDMEMSCDEAVIKRLGHDIKKDYSSSLLTLATSNRMIGGAPLAFGEGDTKDRIKNVLRYKKPGGWALALATLVLIAVLTGLLTDPVGSRGAANAPRPLDLSDIGQMNIGSEMPWLIYGDGTKAIMQGTFGLLVYDLDKRKIQSRILYEELEEQNIGIPFLRATVSNDGSEIYLGSDDPGKGTVSDFTHVLDVKTLRIRTFSGQPKPLFATESLFASEGQKFDEYSEKYPDFQSKLIGALIVEHGDSFFYLRADSDWSVKSLELVRRSHTDNAEEVYRIFDQAR
jgi:beta-lactamase regulating signal transducer with metallopeptidase domain